MTLRAAERHAANAILDRQNADPDDDAAIVARAALRLAATAERAGLEERTAHSCYDPETLAAERIAVLDEVRAIVATAEGACHDGEGLGCEMSGDYPSRGGYGSCNVTIDRESVLAKIDALRLAALEAGKAGGESG